MSLLSQKIGIVGATGVVGQELLNLLEEQEIYPQELKLMASARSQGNQIDFSGKKIEVLETKIEHFKGLDLILFAAATLASCCGEACSVRMSVSRLFDIS